jgi:CRP-like cAMP-binding protein
VDGQVGGCFYVVVYGDLMSDKQKIPLKPGDVVGLKEFFTQDAFRERIVARTKCVLIRLTRQQLNDMFQVSPSGAANVLSMLTRYESHRIRERFEEEFPKERIHLQHQVEYLFESILVF